MFCLVCGEHDGPLRLRDFLCSAVSRSPARSPGHVTIVSTQAYLRASPSNPEARETRHYLVYARQRVVPVARVRAAFAKTIYPPYILSVCQTLYLERNRIMTLPQSEFSFHRTFQFAAHKTPFLSLFYHTYNKTPRTFIFASIVLTRFDARLFAFHQLFFHLKFFLHFYFIAKINAKFYCCNSNYILMQMYIV